MDQDRLKDIQTADLSDSNVNEDFVHWLKTKGPSYLLIVMIVIVSYLFFVRYQQGETAHRAEAWIAYLEAQASGLPASHEDVAKSYADIDSIEALGLLSAGDAYLKSIVTGLAIGSNTDISSALAEEDRTFYLEKADNLYAMVVQLDDETPASALLTVSALNGRAAIAEATGDVDRAEGFYINVITRIEDQYPALAQQAQSRINTLVPLATETVLPTDAEVSARNAQLVPRETVPENTSIDGLSDLTNIDGQ
jgi:hypothetical protein